MFYNRLRSRFTIIFIAGIISNVVTLLGITLLPYLEVFCEEKLTSNYEFNIKQLYQEDKKIELIKEELDKPLIYLINDKEEDKEIIVESRNITKEIKEVKEVEKELYPNNKYKELELICTFYGMGEDENGPGNGTLNCINGLLAPGTIATSPNIPVHTKIYIPELENFSGNNNFEYTVLDRGNPKYIKQIDEDTHRIDIFVEQLKNESWNEYKQRISDLGVQKTIGYMLTEE